jgi:hypothetical protein
MGLTTRVPSTPLRYYVGSQSKRRKLVKLLLIWPVTSCAGIVLYACLPHDYFDASSRVSDRYLGMLLAVVAVAVAAFIIWAISYVALMENWKWITTSPDSALDERLIARKNEALARSFSIFTLVISFEMLFYVVRYFFNSYHQAELAWLMFCLDSILITSIPPAVIAWTEPDGPESEHVAESVLATTTGA